MKLTKKNYFYIIVFAIFALSVYAGLADFDYYWQVDLGRRVLNDNDFNGIYKQVWGTLGVSDYYDHEWLTNVMFYILSLIGVKGISVTKLIISFFLAICNVLYIKEEDKELNTVSIIGIIIFLFLQSTIFIKVKAYSISVGFVMLELLFLKRYKKTERRRYFVYMWILLVLWTNMHSGSMPLFFAISGLYWLVNLRKNKKIPFYCIIYALSTLINPYGYKLILFNFLHNGDKVMKQYVLDWKPIDAKATVGVICAFILLMCIVSMYKVDLKDKLFEVIMMFVFMFMGLQSMRHLIYLTPFFISIILDNKVCIKELSNDVMLYISTFFVGLALLLTIGVFTSKDYAKEYGMNYVDSELEQLIVEACSEGCNGFFVADVDVWSLGFQSFTSGAFPCTRQRFLDSYLIMYSASNDQIKRVIDYYDLSKFLFAKNNTIVDYYNVNNVLYEYLSSCGEYECLYDSDFYCFFRKKSSTE